ncbi:TPA: hypothetical protein HA318_00350, partial [Candidatus Micrarchaeota archaeon]|nr:hypothetical protein [Candidatus Micrarchaeota archaeon]
MNKVNNNNSQNNCANNRASKKPNFIKSFSVLLGLSFFLLILSGFSSPAIISQSCTETNYTETVITPLGTHNVNVSTLNDRCSYFGKNGTVYTNVTVIQDNNLPILDANFSQYLNISGSVINTSINLTTLILDAGTWKMVQNHTMFFWQFNNNFSWMSGEVKQFRTDYYVAENYNDSPKFNVTSYFNFSPVLSQYSPSLLHMYAYANPDANCTTFVGGGNCTNTAVNYTGNVSTPDVATLNLNSIYLVAPADPSNPYFWYQNMIGYNISAVFVSNNTSPINSSKAGACFSLNYSDPAAFNATNKTVNASGLGFCFPIYNITNDIVAYTFINVTEYIPPVNDASPATIIISTRLDAYNQNIVSGNDPVFDTSLHNITINLTGIYYAAVTGQTVDAYNSTSLSAVVSSNVTVGGYCMFTNLHSENYTFVVRNASAATYNVTLPGQLINGTQINYLINITGYDDGIPNATINTPFAANYSDGLQTLNVTLYSVGGSSLNLSTLAITVRDVQNNTMVDFDAQNLSCINLSTSSAECVNNMVNYTGQRTYEINVRMADNAGNWNNSAGSRNFTVDGTAPNYVVVYSPVVDEVIYNMVGGRYLNHSEYDAIGINATWYSLDGGANTTLSSNISLYTFADGVHAINVWVNDSVGNINSTGNITFRLDGRGPVVSMAMVNMTNATNSSTLNVNVSLSEPGSNVTSCNVTVGADALMAGTVSGGYCNA